MGAKRNLKKLKMNTSEELKQLKKQWYDEASSNGNLSKLKQIARHLGTPIRHNYGPKYEFVDGDMEVYVDDYGNYATMKMIDRLVCSTHNERLYVKDICDRFIAKHMPAVEKIIEEKERMKESEALKKMEKELYG